MKTSSVVWGGVVGGLVAAIIVVSAGQWLGVAIEPWSWRSIQTGSLGRAEEWGRSALLLAPLGIVLGVAVAFGSAVVFERVTRRAGWFYGAFVGLVLGVLAASVTGLVPWAASWFAYAYVPATPPLGASDVTWPLVVIIVAALVNGAIAGAWYGVPVHATGPPRRVQWREIYSSGRGPQA